MDALKISVMVEVDGKEYAHEFDNEELFVVNVMRAIRNGKDPAKAIGFLLDVASNMLSKYGKSCQLPPQFECDGCEREKSCRREEEIADNLKMHYLGK